MSSSKKSPPKIIQSVIAYFSSDYVNRPTLGDMEEEFNIILSNEGAAKANVWYLKMAAKSLPKLILHTTRWGINMIFNYLKIAFRNIFRQKMYSAINILGLSIGMVVTILILLFIQKEINYDQYNEYKDRIFRLENVTLAPDGSEASSFSTLAPGFYHLLKEKMPQIEKIARVFYTKNSVVKHDNKTFNETKFFFSDPDILEILSIPLIDGKKSECLKNPNTVILSESTARKYFGSADPIGKDIIIDNEFVLKITGIFKDTPKLAHLHYDFIASYISLNKYKYNDGSDYFQGKTNFSDNVTLIYAKLHKKINFSEIPPFVSKMLDERFGEITMKDNKKTLISTFATIRFRPVTDIHLYSTAKTEIEKIGNPVYITVFSIVAIFVLLIACVNFMNLSTARAMQRAKEVGLRKVIGAQRKLLISQFMGESIFLAFLAFLISIVLILLTAPYFERLSDINAIESLFSDITQWIYLVGIFLFSGIIAGIYPAIYLSSFNPAKILRGEMTMGTKGRTFRRVLVVLQFSVSIALIASVLIVYSQFDYLQNKNLGFDKENVVLISSDNNINANWPAIHERLTNHKNIKEACLSKRAPSEGLVDDPGVRAEINGKMENVSFSFPHNRVGHSFFKTYGMTFVAGRDFSLEHPTDSTKAYILNESAVKKLGFKTPAEAIGLKIQRGEVIGVVKDFNYESLKSEIVPIITYINYRAVNTLSIRISSINIDETFDFIKSVIGQYNKSDIQFTFLEDKLNELYKNEHQMLEMFWNFSIIAIFIACLGLFGLASFTAERKQKEIGIRKVFGAKSFDIIRKITNEFSVLVLISNLVAIPVSFLIMNNWLDTFAYKSSISPLIYLLAAFLALIISFLTVGFQAFKAARQNPAKSLRSE